MNENAVNEDGVIPLKHIDLTYILEGIWRRRRVKFDEANIAFFTKIAHNNDIQMMAWLSMYRFESPAVKIQFIQTIEDYRIRVASLI